MSDNLSAEVIAIAPTPSQHLFSVWSGLCGNTVVCSGVMVNNAATLSEKKFFAAWEQWLRTSYEVNIRVAYSSEESEPLLLTLDDSVTADSCFRFINREHTAIEQIVDGEIQQLLNAELDTAGKANHCLCVIQFSQHKYAVILAVEHMLADGLGVDVLLNRYLDLLDNPQQPAVSAEQRYRQDKPLLDSYASYEEISSPFTRQYVEEVLTKRYFWNPDAQPLTHRKGHYKRLQKSLSAPVLNNVNRYLSAQKISLFPWLTSGFIDSFFSSQPAEKELLLQIPTHGRKFNQQILDKNIVGCFAQAFLLHATRSEQTALPSTQRLNQLQRYVFDCMGNEVDQLTARRNAASIKKSALPSRLQDDAFALALRKSMPTNVYFSFYGTSSLPSQHTHFALENYHLATTNLAGALDVMLVQYGENLEISFNYDALFFNETTIAALAETFEQVITQVDLTSAVATEASTSPAAVDTASYQALIACINKYSLEPVDEHDEDSHLEIDLGLDSLLKTRVLVDFMALTRRATEDINREKFYSAVTLSEMLNVVAVTTAEPAV